MLYLNSEMKENIIKLYRRLAPEIIRDKLFEFRKNRKLNALNLNTVKKNIVDYIKSKETLEKEESEVLEYLIRHNITTFPYQDMNQTFDVKIHNDKAAKLYYGDYENKKLYFKPQSTKESNKNYLIGLLNEQLPFSPHRYLTKTFDVNEQTILADIGAAEGNFSLSIVDKVKKIYLFESDKEWIKALQKTFEPWKEKVEIIHAFVSNTNDIYSTSIDSYFEGKEKPNFLKLDVEGFEDIVLEGAAKLLEQNQLQVAICTYHKQGDDLKYKKFFEDRSFKTEFSERFMIFIDDINNIAPPYIRKGLLRATK
jgi:hypothetical protein